PGVAVMATIKLVELGEEHLETSFRWMSDEELRRGLLFDRAITPTSHRAWYADYRADPSQAIYAALSSESHVGNFGYRRIDRRHRTADLWMYIGLEYRGKGLARSVLRQGLDLGFGQLQLRKICLSVRADHVRALALYIRAGFVLEGILRAQ